MFLYTNNELSKKRKNYHILAQKYLEINLTTKETDYTQQITKH
jgi:hypothetical protein